MRQVLGIYSAPRAHWVGDGFPVRTILSHQHQGEHVSPFLMLDYAGPVKFEPTTRRRGVGEHPHRGFETVTIVYKGEVEHRDSTGAGGVIGPGDVQWMTAASGLIHEEFHSPAFAAQGGRFEMVQLWVNLPARDKMAPPGYQGITAGQIPEVALPGAAGTLRVIAGEYASAQGPARSFTPMNVWDLRLHAGHRVAFDLPAGHTTALFVLHGSLRIDGKHSIRAAELAVMERDGSRLEFEVSEDATVLLLNGEPLNEPVVGYGPFVMNTQAEIVQAIDDFNSGRFGQIGQ